MAASRITRVKVPLAVDASGDGSTTVYANGELVGFLYEPGTLDTGADITITDAATGIKLAVGTNMGTTEIGGRITAATATLSAGMGTVHASNISTAITVAGGDGAFTDVPPIVSGETTVTVAQGGVSKAGTLYLLVRQ